MEQPQTKQPILPPDPTSWTLDQQLDNAIGGPVDEATKFACLNAANWLVDKLEKFCCTSSQTYPPTQARQVLAEARRLIGRQP